jgi:hypothetical protein
VRLLGAGAVLFIASCSLFTNLDDLDGERTIRDPDGGSSSSGSSGSSSSGWSGASDGSSPNEDGASPKDATRDAIIAEGTCGSQGCDCLDGYDCNRRCTGGQCRMRCDQGSKCDFTCVEGGCAFECKGGAECTLRCPLGSCTAIGDPATVVLYCPGNHCTATCHDGYSCAIKECTADCTATCTTGSKCSNDCHDPSCI